MVAPSIPAFPLEALIDSISPTDNLLIMEAAGVIGVFWGFSPVPGILWIGIVLA
jgi:hypothetical protein